MVDLTLKILDDRDHLIETARVIALNILEESAAGKQVRVALAGGSTPRRLHEALAAESGIYWPNVHIYFGDERTVDHDHPDSNYLMAYETLIESVNIPAAQTHRMRGEIDPENAAREYEASLRRSFGLGPTDIPVFDLIILGMGADGHTASLFPDTAALEEQKLLCVANAVPQLDTHRITLTFPVINASRNVMFLVAGADKANALKAVLEPQEGAVPPAGLIQPVDGNLYWLVDKAAASELTVLEDRL